MSQRPTPNRRDLAELLPRAASAGSLATASLALLHLSAGAVCFGGASTLPLRMDRGAALAVLLAGVSLWILSAATLPGPRRRAGRVCALLAAGIGLASLARGLLPQLGPVPSLLRIVPVTSVAVLAIGTALLLVDRGSRAARWSAELLGLATAALALFSLMLRAYGLDPGSTSISQAVMSLPAAIASGLLALGVLTARRDLFLARTLASAGVGGTLLRRALPPVLLIPPALGWMRLLGERAGLYDAETGLALMVLASTAALATVIGISASQLERQEAERRLAASERQRLALELDRIFTLSRDLLCVAGMDGYFKRVNPAWERTLGFTPDELTAMPFLDFVHPDDHPATLAAFESQVAKAETIVSFENRYRCKDGSHRWLLWTSTPVPNDGLLYAVAHDITERKRDEDALRRAKVAAEAANKELEAFSYSVSHDLRAPLRAIDGFSQALLEDCADALNGEGRGYLQRVRSAAQRMSELIEDLLTLARLSRTELRREKIDLSAVARSVVDDLREREPDRSVIVTIREGMEARGDARLLRAALENLLGNAWKYTRKVERAAIEFGRALLDGEEAYFVRDNGAGFDMAHADMLFGAFQRLHRAEEFEGSGVGLATVQRIIRLHGGRVWAEGFVDEGATFFFTVGRNEGTSR